MTLRYAVRIVAVCIVVGVVIGCYLYFFPHQSSTFGDQTKYLFVKRGDTVYDIGYELKQMGAIASEFNFLMFSKLLVNLKRVDTP